MRIGILADIHEDVERLGLALGVLREAGAEELVVLGDICDTGARLEQTVALLTGAGVVGVWGNHDLGLCYQVSERTRATYPGPVLGYMATLSTRLEREDCLFSHGLPHWEPTDPAVYYLAPRPETPEGRAGAFRASSHRVTFVGHFHRWLAVTPAGALAWAGDEPLALPADQRRLVVVAAVCDGWCALLDTGSGVLLPQRIV
jgi:predicted phosphodiesterase